MSAWTPARGTGSRARERFFPNPSVCDGDTDVADMIARFAGASLGLLAFSVTAIAGLYVQNPVNVTLSRSILALFIFCSIGLVLGAAAQRVIDEHQQNHAREIRKRFHPEATGDAAGADDAVPVEEATEQKKEASTGA